MNLIKSRKNILPEIFTDSLFFILWGRRNPKQARQQGRGTENCFDRGVPKFWLFLISFLHYTAQNFWSRNSKKRKKIWLQCQEKLWGLVQILTYYHGPHKHVCVANGLEYKIWCRRRRSGVRVGVHPNEPKKSTLSHSTTVLRQMSEWANYTGNRPKLLIKKGNKQCVQKATIHPYIEVKTEENYKFHTRASFCPQLIRAHAVPLKMAGTWAPF